MVCGLGEWGVVVSEFFDKEFFISFFFRGGEGGCIFL